MRSLMFEPISNDNHALILYELLQERQPNESISHKDMPCWQDHLNFVRTSPYKEWCVVVDESNSCPVGAYYITKQNEIGIAVFERFRRKGYAYSILDAVIQLNPGVKFLANINPVNEKSKKLFRKLGFKHVQDTFVREPSA